MEASWASGQTELWPEVLTLLPTWLLESWSFLGLSFLMQNRVKALYLGLVMIQPNKIINTKEL